MQEILMDELYFLSQCVEAAFSEPVQANLKDLLLPKTDLRWCVCEKTHVCVYKGVGLPLIGIVEQKCKFLFVTTLIACNISCKKGDLDRDQQLGKNDSFVFSSQKSCRKFEFA